MTRTRGRLEDLEKRVEVTHEALTLPDGSRVLYAQPDALEAVGRPYGAERCPCWRGSWRRTRQREWWGFGGRSWGAAKVGRFRGRVRKLEREVETALVAVEHEDGTVSRWPLGDDLFKEVFLHVLERGGRHFDGEDPSPAHPFVEALHAVTNLEALKAEHGTMLGFWIREDAIVRGLAQLPGTPMTWSEDGTVRS